MSATDELEQASPATLVNKVTVAIRLACLYAGKNVAIENAIKELVPTLDAFLTRRGRAAILGEHGLAYVNGRLIRGKKNAGWLKDWNDLLERYGLGGIFFSGVWGEEHVRALLDVFVAATAEKGDARAQVLERVDQAVLAPAVIRLFTPEQAAAYVREEEEGHLDTRSLAAFYYARLIALAEASGKAVVAQGNPDLYSRLSQQALLKLLGHLDSRAFEHQLLLQSARRHSDELQGYAVHCANVTVYSLLVGRLLGLNENELLRLGYAALYHDVGRARGTPDGPNAHVEDGMILCLKGRSSGPANRARLIVAREHLIKSHGFMRRHRPPHVLSAIVSLCNAYDLLENGLLDGPPLGPRGALAALAAEGRFDQPWLDLLSDALGTFPRGSCVLVPGGGAAVVVEGGARRGQRPLLREVLDPEGAPLPGDRLVEVDAALLRDEQARAQLIDWREVLARPLPQTLVLLEGQAAEAAPAPEPEPAAPIELGGQMLLSDDMARAYQIGATRAGEGGNRFDVTIQGDGAFPGLREPAEQAVVELAPGEPAVIERERELLSRGLPGLVRLLDAGKTGAGEPYLVLERLAPSPSARFRRRTDPATALDVFLNALDDLRRLHGASQGLVLCGIDPGAIQLRMGDHGRDLDDATYLQRLASGDWSPVFARIADARDKRELERERGAAGEQLGSPIYLAPEAAPILLSGRVLQGHYSPKSDVYALTLTLYTLLSGRFPYEKTGVYQLEGGELQAALSRIKHEHLDPIDPEALAAVVDDSTRERLERLLRMGLAPDPNLRPSAQALLRVARQAFDAREHQPEGPGLRLRQGRLPGPTGASYGI